MKRRPLWLLTLMLLLVAATAPVSAAPQPPRVTLAAYRERLNVALHRLEEAGSTSSPDVRRQELQAARTELAGVWQVETPAGTFRADHGPLVTLLERAVDQPDLVTEARKLAREYLASADAVETAPTNLIPDARTRLNSALAGLNARRRWTDWLSDLIGQFFRRFFTQETADRAEAAGPYLKWGSLVVGLVGVLLLVRGLVRALSGQAGADEASLKSESGREPERPLSPDELRLKADRTAVEGEYREALRLLHLSLLKQFDRLGLMRYAPAATNREHEWLLRREHPELARLLHPLNDLTEARLYSGQAVSERDYQQAREWVEWLWREGDAASRSKGATGGPSSLASSS